MRSDGDGDVAVEERCRRDDGGRGSTGTGKG